MHDKKRKFFIKNKKIFIQIGFFATWALEREHIMSTLYDGSLGGDLNDPNKIAALKQAIHRISERSSSEAVKSGLLGRIWSHLTNYQQKQSYNAIKNSHLLSDIEMRYSSVAELKEKQKKLSDLIGFLSSTLEGDKVQGTARQFFAQKLQEWKTQGEYIEQEILVKTWKKNASWADYAALFALEENSGHRLSLKQAQEIYGQYHQQITQQINKLKKDTQVLIQLREQVAAISAKDKGPQNTAKGDSSEIAEQGGTKTTDIASLKREAEVLLLKYTKLNETIAHGDFRYHGKELVDQMDVFKNTYKDFEEAVQQATQRLAPRQKLEWKKVEAPVALKSGPSLEEIRNHPNQFSLVELVHVLEDTGEQRPTGELRALFMEQAHRKAAAIRTSLFSQYQEIKEKTHELQRTKELTESEWKKKSQELSEFAIPHRELFTSLLECQQKIPELSAQMTSAERSFFSNSGHVSRMLKIDKILAKEEMRARGKENLLTIGKEAESSLMSDLTFVIQSIGEIPESDLLKNIQTALNNCYNPSIQQIKKSSVKELEQAVALIDQLLSKLSAIVQRVDVGSKFMSVIQQKLTAWQEIKTAMQDELTIKKIDKDNKLPPLDGIYVSFVSQLREAKDFEVDEKRYRLEQIKGKLQTILQDTHLTQRGREYFSDKLEKLRVMEEQILMELGAKTEVMRHRNMDFFRFLSAEEVSGYRYGLKQREKIHEKLDENIKNYFEFMPEIVSRQDTFEAQIKEANSLEEVERLHKTYREKEQWGLWNIKIPELKELPKRIIKNLNLEDFISLVEKYQARETALFEIVTQKKESLGYRGEKGEHLLTDGNFPSLIEKRAYPTSLSLEQIVDKLTHEKQLSSEERTLLVKEARVKVLILACTLHANFQEIEQEIENLQNMKPTNGPEYSLAQIEFRKRQEIALRFISECVEDSQSLMDSMTRIPELHQALSDEDRHFFSQEKQFALVNGFRAALVREALRLKTMKTMYF